MSEEDKEILQDRYEKHIKRLFKGFLFTLQVPLLKNKNKFNKKNNPITIIKYCIIL